MEVYVEVYKVVHRRMDGALVSPIVRGTHLEVRYHEYGYVWTGLPVLAFATRNAAIAWAAPLQGRDDIFVGLMVLELWRAETEAIEPIVALPTLTSMAQPWWRNRLYGMPLPALVHEAPAPIGTVACRGGITLREREVLP